jgi:hypothetical protein
VFSWIGHMCLWLAAWGAFAQALQLQAVTKQFLDLRWKLLEQPKHALHQWCQTRRDPTPPLWTCTLSVEWRHQGAWVSVCPQEHRVIPARYYKFNIDCRSLVMGMMHSPHGEVVVFR